MTSATWGDLRAGDVILDKTDVPWTVVAEPKRVLVDGKGSPAGLVVRVPIKNEAMTQTVVVKPASEPVTLVQEPDVDQQRGVVEDAFGEDKVELIASETTDETEAREAATKENPLHLPEIHHPATLRSHVYLQHDLYIADVDSTLALEEHHRKSHADYPDKGYPHVHDLKEN